jgi:AraC family transcriptional regulator, transcriptional activator FtrA
VRKNAASRHSVALLLIEGFSIFEVGIASEVFGYDRSRYLGVPWYRFLTCGLKPGLVTSEIGVQAVAARGLDGLREAQTVIVPPVNSGDVPTQVLAELRLAHHRGARMVSLCTGAFILAEAGLLDGRPATTHWTAAGRLASCYPAVKVDPGPLFVDDGDVLTSAGSAAALDLALHLVRCDYGAELASTVARRLVVPPHRDGGQAQFIQDPMPAEPGLDLFAQTLAWAVEHIHEPVSVSQLAARSVMSPRTFARRFRAATGTTPHRWITRQRVLLARRMLENTDASVEEVARRCGLGSAANMRAQFATVIRTSPAAYRRTFQTSPATAA